MRAPREKEKGKDVDGCPSERPNIASCSIRGDVAGRSGSVRRHGAACEADTARAFAKAVVNSQAKFARSRPPVHVLEDAESEAIEAYIRSAGKTKANRLKLVRAASGRVLKAWHRHYARHISIEGDPDIEDDGYAVWTAGQIASSDRQVSQVYVSQLMRRLAGIDDGILTLIADFANPFDAASELRIPLLEALSRWGRIRDAAQALEVATSTPEPGQRR